MTKLTELKSLHQQMAHSVAALSYVENLMRNYDGSDDANDPNFAVHIGLSNLWMDRSTEHQQLLQKVPVLLRSKTLNAKFPGITNFLLRKYPVNDVRIQFQTFTESVYHEADDCLNALPFETHQI